MTKQEFLSMSLPYGMKCCTVEINRINDLISCHFGNIVIARIKPNDDIDVPLPIAQINPILHPLSDLTKPIEHKGETFVPIEKLNEMFGYEECKLVYYINSGLGWGIDSGFSSTAITFSDMYLPIQKLIEWHFDIADLISKGEAIDVNTLDINPYK